MWFRVVSVMLTRNISHTCSFILAAFSDGDGPLAAGAALQTAVVFSISSSYMRGGGESQVDAEGQRSRAERSWRSKHWKKVKNQSPDLQSSKLAIRLCIPMNETRK